MRGSVSLFTHTSLSVSHIHTMQSSSGSDQTHSRLSCDIRSSLFQCFHPAYVIVWMETCLDNLQGDEWLSVHIVKYSRPTQPFVMLMEWSIWVWQAVCWLRACRLRQSLCLLLENGLRWLQSSPAAFKHSSYHATMEKSMYVLHNNFLYWWYSLKIWEISTTFWQISFHFPV